MPKETSSQELTIKWLDEVVSNLVNGRDINQAHAEATRELTMRAKCFPRWVQEGRMLEMDAHDRLERLTAAVWFLDQLKAYRKAQKDGSVPSTGDKTGEPF